MNTQDYSEYMSATPFSPVRSFVMPKTFRNRLRFRYWIWRLKRRGVRECNIIHGRITRVQLTPDMTGKKILAHIQRNRE